MPHYWRRDSIPELSRLSKAQKNELYQGIWPRWQRYGSMIPAMIPVAIFPHLATAHMNDGIRFLYHFLVWPVVTVFSTAWLIWLIQTPVINAEAIRRLRLRQSREAV